MIATRHEMRTPQKSSFSRLVEYLLDRQNKEHRVGEVQYTNILSTGKEFALAEIAATQERNIRAKSDKTYHLMLSFRAGEQPSQEILREIEEKVCQQLGFGDHQRISVVHHDTDNLHVHIAINKIHPEKFTLFEPYYDKLSLQTICSALEEEYDLQVDNHEIRRTESQANAINMEKASGVQSLIGWVQRECLDEIQQAGSWEDLHNVLEKNGLEIRSKGRGLVILSKDGAAAAKASSIDRSLSKSNLEKKFGVFKPKQGEANEFYEVDTQKPSFEHPREISEHRLRRLSERHLASYGKEKSESVLSSDACVDRGEFEGLRWNGDPYSYQEVNRQQGYTRGPTPNPKDSSRLWKTYQKNAETTRREQSKACKKAREDRDRKIRIARGSSRLQNSFLRLIRFSVVRNLARLVLKTGTNAVIKAAETKYQQEKQKIYRQIIPRSWNDWLKHQAQQGNKEALEYLRARKTGAEIQNETLTGSVREELSDVHVDAVTRKGTRILKGNIRDSGDMLHLTKATEETMEEGLRLALRKFGKNITVTGSDAFKKNIINAAVNGDLDINFSDPAMEKDRKQLVDKKKVISRVDEYIAKKNLLKNKVSDIMNHRRCESTDAGDIAYGGVRRQGEQSLVLFHTGTETLVLPISDDAASKLKGIKVGSLVRVSSAGKIERITAKRRKR